MPEGREIMIAIEKPNAMTTNNALIFLLDKFLTALVKAPKSLTPYSASFLIQRTEEGQHCVQLRNKAPDSKCPSRDAANSMLTRNLFGTTVYY